MEKHNGIDVSVDRMREAAKHHQCKYNDDRVAIACLEWGANRIAELEARVAELTGIIQQLVKTRTIPYSIKGKSALIKANDFILAQAKAKEA